MTRFRSNGRAAIAGYETFPKRQYNRQHHFQSVFPSLPSLPLSLSFYPSALRFYPAISRRPNGFKRQVTASKPRSARVKSYADFTSRVDFSTRLHSTKVSRRRYNRVIFLLRIVEIKFFAKDSVVNLPRNRYRARKRISLLVIRANC